MIANRYPVADARIFRAQRDDKQDGNIGVGPELVDIWDS